MHYNLISISFNIFRTTNIYIIWIGENPDKKDILFLFSHTEPDYPESDLDDAENTDPSEEAQNPS